MIRIVFLIGLCSLSIKNISIARDGILVKSSLEKSNINIDLHLYTIPILKYKENNAILRLEINIDETEQTYVLQTLDVALECDVKDIENIKIFYTKDQLEFNDDDLVSQVFKSNDLTQFKIDRSLHQGFHVFWLSIKLSEDANIEDTISVAAHSLVIDGSKRSFDHQNYAKKYHLGLALRRHGQEGIDTYRIPGLVTTNNGTLIAVYDVRKNSAVDLQEDIKVGMSRSLDGGKTWSSMRIIMDMGDWGGLPENENGIGDPCILVDELTGVIWVAAVWAHGHPGQRNWWASQPGIRPEETSQLMLVKSADDGLSWSHPINITEQVKKPGWYLLLQGPGKGITLRDGTLVFPAQFKDEDQVPHSTIIYSKDRGESWSIGTGAKSKTTEAQVVELDDGQLMLNMRDDRGREGNGARSVYMTENLGVTWSKHPTSFRALPEPVCMASLIKMEDVLIFSNPAHTNERKNMTIKVSFDEGQSWLEENHFLIDEGNGRGYSCLTAIDDEWIGILYEGSGSDLVFQKFRKAELMSRK